jgi:hypothetical protein
MSHAIIVFEQKPPLLEIHIGRVDHGDQIGNPHLKSPDWKQNQWNKVMIISPLQHCGDISCQVKAQR